MYGLLADLVVGIHAIFVLFVVLGGLLVIRWPWLAVFHLPAAVWGALISFAGWICPLTPLESSLRRKGGGAGYDDGFIEHYITSLLYPVGLTRGIQIALGVAVVVLNLAFYWRVLGRRGMPAPPGR